MSYYFAYGSNLNRQEMFYRCPGAKPIGNGILPDHELRFRCYATVEPKEGAEVQGVVWEITPGDEKHLDVYEGYPILYHKEWIGIEMQDGPVEALVYVMNDVGKRIAPTESYLNRIRQGYRDFNLDERPLIEAAERSIKG